MHPSLIAEPPFLEGEIAYDVARRLSQLSAEETAALRDDAAAYRRYVELWIHEIKTPIAAIKLMLARGRDASAAGERVNAHTANAPIAAFTPASYVRDNVIGLAAFLLALASTVLILPALGVNS